MKHSKEDTSYFDLISSGNAVIRRIGVGAENVEVTYVNRPGVTSPQRQMNVALQQLIQPIVNAK